MNTIKQFLHLMILLSTISILAISCGRQPASDHDDKHTEHAEEGHTAETAISLNNGEKWEANPETTEGIKNLTNLVDGFLMDQGRNAYLGLKSQLEGEFTMIFQKCTMTGEAHDQLHNYLLPMKGMFERLASEKPEVRRDNLEKLSGHLSRYSKYFQ